MLVRFEKRGGGYLFEVVMQSVPRQGDTIAYNDGAAWVVHEVVWQFGLGLEPRVTVILKPY